MTFFCSKFARKALFFKSEKGFLLCIPEGCVMMDRDNRQMKADYTGSSHTPRNNVDRDNRQMKADYTRLSQ